MSKTYEQEKIEWWDKHLKFTRQDFNLITCDRCNKTGVMYGAFGYGSSYEICEDCIKTIGNSGN